MVPTSSQDEALARYGVSREILGSVQLLLDLLTGFSEAGKVVWYFHLLKNFPLFVVIHTVAQMLKNPPAMQETWV